MKNDDIRRELGRELSGVRISEDLHARILLGTSYNRRRGVGFIRVAAAAAAVVAALGILAGVALARRPEVPDRVTSEGSNKKPDATAAYTPAPSPVAEEISDVMVSGMWVNEDDGLFHLFEACAGEKAAIADVTKNSGLFPCPECFEGCVWIDNEGAYFHEDFDCPALISPQPVNLSVLSHMDYESCGECTDSTVVYEADAPIGEMLILPTAEPTQPPVKEITYDGPAVFYHDSLSSTHIVLTGWAAQNMAVNWALTPGGFGMVFTGSAVETDEKGEMASPDTLENADLDYCWCTENGQYIHSVGNCTNMKDSFVALITPALEFSGNKAICPECGDGLGCVYYTKSGTYFHSDEKCNGMKNAESHTRRAAYAAGKIPCPTCLEYESSNPVE